MNVYEKVISMIEEATYTGIPIKETSNLYTDLGLDSLAFVRLLLQIEETFPITFDLLEMEMCLQVDGLISLVAEKLEEGNIHD